MRVETARQIQSDGNASFREMRTAFDRAWSNRPGIRSELVCAFAGLPCRIRIVGSGLGQQVTRVFEHLVLKETPATFQLKIDLWDQLETSTPCPLDPVPVQSRLLQSTPYVEYGLILGSGEDRFLGCQRPHVMTWLDRASRHFVGCVAGHDRLPLYDRGKPLHFPLLLWHQDRDAEVIHAALVAKNGNGVLFAGRGGAGKSTSALACLESGFDYLGDDYISLQSSGGSFAGYSLYDSTWIMADHLRRFPRLIPHALHPEHPDQEKTLVPLSRVFPDRLASFAPVRVLVLPRLAENSSARVRPASKADALFALAPSSILLLPSSGARTLDKLARLAEQVPCYWLDLGCGLSGVPDLVEELLDPHAQ